jgi:hypothetical protein
MIPAEFLAMYLTANAIALAILALALLMPRVARWAAVVIFVWASLTNTVTALSAPEAYLGYAALTPSAWYQQFILGWFSEHIAAMVLPIAAGQMIIAILLAMPRPWRALGVAGALTFLLAIAPLGVGAGFPFSITFGAAILIADRKLAARPRRSLCSCCRPSGAKPSADSGSTRADAERPEAERTRRSFRQARVSAMHLVTTFDGPGRHQPSSGPLEGR